MTRRILPSSVSVARSSIMIFRRDGQGAQGTGKESDRGRLVSSCLGGEDIVFDASFIESSNNMLMTFIFFVECFVSLFPLAFICAVEEL